MENLDTNILATYGYQDITFIDGRCCATAEFAFTFALVVNISMTGYERRYCYEHYSDALKDLHDWDGKNHPDGPWIKCKGVFNGDRVDLINPKIGDPFEDTPQYKMRN